MLWLGVNMTKAGVNENGETIYNVEIPESTYSLSFTNKALETLYIDYSGGDKRFIPVDNEIGTLYDVIDTQN